NSLVEYARAAKPDMFFNARKHRSLREARDTIMHELIHYELADTGKYAGHGIDFKRRARKLGILGRIELDQCFSGEETLNRPHTMELKKIPREEFADQMDGHLEKLRHLAACTPLKLREKIYREAREIEAIWGGYRNAVQGGEDFVTEEIIKSRRGPRGKPLDVLIKEGRELRARRDTLQQKYSETK